MACQSPGSPDYQRDSLWSGVLLSSSARVHDENAVLFQAGAARRCGALGADVPECVPLVPPIEEIDVNEQSAQPSSNPAQAYEDYFVSSMFRPWTADLLDRATPQPGERVLDVACGTGIVARMIAHRLHGQSQLVGIDLSPAMVEIARATAAQEGVAIEWHVGNADALPFADASFDLVVIQQGLQFFPDRAAALRDVFRVLAPGGRVVTATWTDTRNNPLNQVLAEVIERHLGTPALHLPFSLGDPEQLHALFVEAGFDAIVVERVTRTVRFPLPDKFVELGLASASAAVPALQTMNTGERAALIEVVQVDMAVPLREFIQGDDVISPMETHITLAHKRR